MKPEQLNELIKNRRSVFPDQYRIDRELTKEIKEYDRNTVRELPRFLARAGFQIFRTRS